MNILYFAPIPFDEIKQRPQCLAEELSKYHTVYYIEPTTSLIRCLFKGGKQWKKENKNNGYFRRSKRNYNKIY